MLVLCMYLLRYAFIYLLHDVSITPCFTFLSNITSFIKTMDIYMLNLEIIYNR